MPRLNNKETVQQKRQLAAKAARRAARAAARQQSTKSATQEKPKKQAEPEQPTQEKKAPKPAETPKPAPAKKQEKKAPKPVKAPKTEDGKKQEKKAPKPTEAKTEGKKKNKPRSFNNKPVLSKTTGLNISPAKVKNVVSQCVLNREVHSALTELRNARPHTVKKTVGGDVVSEEVAGTPVSELSESTRQFVQHAVALCEQSQKLEYAKKKVSAMSADDKKSYQTAKSDAKTLLAKEHENSQDSAKFNVEEFNKGYSPTFYDDFYAEQKTETTDEWKTAIDRVSKLKNRFSNHSRVLLSAFVECLIRQLALNGVVSCVADDKKIVQLSHMLDTTREGFEQRFPLYPFLTTLSTFKQAQQYLTNPDEYVKALGKDKDEEGNDVKTSKVTDLFVIDGISSDKQHQFKYYIGETCREVRMSLSETKNDDSSAKDVYNHTSVSKVFKNFCSTLVCEFLIRVGKMLHAEIQSRGIKTVNDTVINTVILQYHLAHGVDPAKTLEVVDKVVNKYNKYITDRHSKKDDTPPEEQGDLPYEKE